MLRVVAFFPALLLAQQPVINQYCVGCHNSTAKAAGLALDTAKADDTATWEKVLRRVRGRTMPPVGLPRPKESDYQNLVATLETKLDANKVDPGRTDTFRRLNRTEYQNSIRDLLAVDVDVTGLLPSDDASHGFDNVTVGNLSPTLLERYLGAARKISRLAIGIPPKQVGGETVMLPPDLTQEEHFEDLPLGTRGGTVVKYTFPLDAEYEIQIRLQRDRNEHVEGLRGNHVVELMLDGERIQAFTAKPPGQGQDHSVVDREFNIRLRVSAGPHVIAAAFPKQSSTLLETERQPYQAHFNMDRHPRITPAVFSVTVNGPYAVKGPGDTPSRRAIFVCQAQDEPCAKKILSHLTRRAYRRPSTEADLAVPLKFYRDARKTEGFEAGIEMGLRAILVSPEFLFRVEQDPAGAAPKSVYRISDLELASRLSFFLWSSIPDEELLAAAVRGDLHQPAVMRKQVQRMLADERSKMLVTNFADQWLYLRNLASITPDMRAFPDFDDNLRQAFRKETHLFFESVMREDRSVLDLLRADYSFLNERLAKHYGVPNVYGSRFRKVTFGPETMRGGLLRQGSILTVTSYATRTSPVIRGKWILDNILGVPPPPPPPNVPALEEAKAAMKKMTMRERLSEHRKNPACSGCHKLMDPVGFSLENFDAVGRWRQAEDGTPVDVSGGLPDGAKFSGVAGLEKALLTRPELFATTITEKLLTYSLGRGVEYTDAPAVRQIVRQAQKSDFRFSSFIQGIAGSPSFQLRRAQ
ncbi:MAG: DUF1592 domain-containing protein [Acidobacteria bacterium]|nr:DUF1592 domain-containing protein [Acidobacteriota bacterium]